MSHSLSLSFPYRTTRWRIGLARISEVLSVWQRRMRERAELSRWQERDMRDAGLSRHQVEYEIAKPFWRA